MKQLSVAIPTYGKSYFLAECLQSIANQTISVECIVCEGGSSFDFSEPRWNWVKRKQLIPDPGMVRCWSEAANSSQSDYLAFLADDNAWEPKFAEKMLSFMENYPSCEVVFGNQFLINEASKIDLSTSQTMTKSYGRHKLSYGLLDSECATYLIQNNSIPLECCVIRRSVWERYGSFAPQAFGAFDLHFFTKLLSYGVQFGFLPEYLARFRQHPNSYTISQRQEHLKGAIWALQNIESSNPKIQKLLRKKILIYCENYLRLDLPEQEREKVEKRLVKYPLGLLTLAKSRILRDIRHIIKQ